MSRALQYIDTHKAYKQLTESGLAERVAEAVVNFVIESQKIEYETLATKIDLINLRTDLKEDIASVRAELKEDIASVRTELKEDISSVRTELKEDIASVRAELKEDIASVRAELKEDIASLRSELKEETLKLSGRFDNMRWVMGVLVSLNIAILVKLFLMK
jgi:hypothetical protein